MIGQLRDMFWSQTSQFWPSWCFLVPMEMLDDTQSTFWAESCMIGHKLGSVLEQNEPDLSILVFLGPNRDAGWHSEHVLG